MWRGEIEGARGVQVGEIEGARERVFELEEEVASLSRRCEVEFPSEISRLRSQVSSLRDRLAEAESELTESESARKRVQSRSGTGSDNLRDSEDRYMKAEKLKEEAKNVLSEYEAKLSKSKVEVDLMIKNAQKESETNIIKINDQFFSIFENRKKMAEDKIKQMKLQATKDIKNYSVEVAIIALEKIIKNSVDKKKLDKIYISSIDEAKKILKNKSI